MAKHLNQKTVFETKYFKVQDIEIEFSQDLKKHFQIIDKSDTSLIVPINDKNEIILISEYFYAADVRGLGFPKGRIEEGLDALETANKELQEETGYRAAQLDPLGVLTMAPAYNTQKVHVFLARDLTESKLEGDEDEEIEVLPTPFAKVEEMIDKGEINEARVISAFYLAKKFLGK